MSQESVRSFYQGIREDPGLRQKLAKEMEAANGNLVLAAKALGFDFTAEEFEEQSQSQGAGLSDQELEAIGGGLYPEGSDIGSGGLAFADRRDPLSRKKKGPGTNPLGALLDDE